MKTVHLKTDRFGRRPWIFRKMVRRPEGIEDGDAVEILDRSGRYVGAGIYNGRSTIALRVLHRGARQALDADFLRRRIRDAVYLRREVLALDRLTDAYRVVHAEADGLSGLVVDRYADVLVVEAHALGIWRLAREIETALRASFPGARVLVRAEERAQALEKFDAGPPPAPIPAEIREHGIVFRVDAGGGHKTGFFLDQRENRDRFTRYCADRTVLDGCCYTGGFSLHARIRGRAGRVVGVDLDEKAIEIARENARANGAEVEFVHADLFDFLRARASEKARFDAIVLDPPKLASTRGDLPRASSFLRDLNALAMAVLKNHGLLLTSCCTGLVSPEDFLASLRRAAARVGRELRLLEIGGAAPDHPVSPDFPESRYLTSVLASARRAEGAE